MNDSKRVPLIDFLRGLAVILMIIFHFNFDLSSFRITSPHFYKDEFWLGVRLLIMILFITLVGINLVLSQAGVTQKTFWHRQLKVLSCALAVSGGSYLLLPASFIYFGVLHFIFIGSILGCLIVGANWARFNLIIGIFIIVFSQFYQSEVFDNPLLNWIGLTTHNPLTEDYVPLLPWLGVLLIGIFIGHQILPRMPNLLRNFQIKPINFIGKNSLVIYMIHQPIMIGLFILYIKLR